MKDNGGRTPFDRLCEQDFDEVLSIHDESFACTMVWWYNCLGIDILAQG